VVYEEEAAIDEDVGIEFGSVKNRRSVGFSGSARPHPNRFFHRISFGAASSAYHTARASGHPGMNPAYLRQNYRLDDGNSPVVRALRPRRMKMMMAGHGHSKAERTTGLNTLLDIYLINLRGDLP